MDGKRWARSGRERSSGGGGFSLLELLTVLVVLAVVAGISAPRINNLLTGLDFRKQVGRITAHLRAVRLESISSGRTISVRIRDNLLVLERVDQQEMERNPGLNNDGELSMTPDVLFFTPQSTVTPATLRFEQSGRSRTITMDPLTALPVVN